MHPRSNKRHTALRDAPRTRWKRGVLVLSLALSIGASVATLTPRPAMADAGSRSEAIDQALARNGGGKVLGVREERGSDGRITYSVKVLADGRVRVIRIRGK